MSYNFDGSNYNPAAGDTSGNAKVIGPVAHDGADTGKYPVKIGGVYRAAPVAVTTGDIADVLCDALGRVAVNLGWTPSLQADEAVDDSDKSFTVPASTEWWIQSIWVELTTSADVGNRQMCIELQDNAADVIFRVKTGAVQAASLTRNYALAPHLPDLTAFRDTTYLSTPFPDIVLPAAYIIRVYDSAAIAAAADDMVVQILLKTRSV